jgi:hypothetical protein
MTFFSSLAQVNYLEFNFEYDYSYKRDKDNGYRMENKLATFVVGKTWSTERPNDKTFFNASMQISFDEESKTFSNGAIISPNDFVRLSIDGGKSITGLSVWLFDVNGVFSVGLFRDIGISPWSDRLLNFRINPALEVVFAKSFFIRGSAYKVLAPLSPTGTNLVAGVKFKL